MQQWHLSALVCVPKNVYFHFNDFPTTYINSRFLPDLTGIVISIGPERFVRNSIFTNNLQNNCVSYLRLVLF